MKTTVARLAVQAVIEIDPTQYRADTIVTEVTGRQVHASQSGRLGLEIVVAPTQAPEIQCRLRACEDRTWVTYQR